MNRLVTKYVLHVKPQQWRLTLYFSDDEISDNAEEFSEKSGEYFVYAVVEGCCKLTKNQIFFMNLCVFK